MEGPQHLLSWRARRVQSYSPTLLSVMTQSLVHSWYRGAHTARLLIALGILGCTSTAERSAGSVQRPTFAITATDTFRAASVPAYQGAHAETYAFIDANLPRHLENMQRWVRQRSISAQNDGIQEMARLVQSDLTKLGFKETAIVPTSGHPAV